MKKKLQIVLKKDVENLGLFGDVKEVAAGFARNYLVPKGLALYLSDKRSKEILRQKEQKLKLAEKDIEELKKLAEKIEGIEIEIKAKTTKEGKLYGAVRPDEVVKALSKKKIKVEERQIEMESVKETGVAEVIANLGYNIKVRFKVKISPASSRQVGTSRGATSSKIKN